MKIACNVVQSGRSPRSLDPIAVNNSSANKGDERLGIEVAFDASISHCGNLIQCRIR